MKKLIIACTIMAMALVMAMPCFAHEVMLPALPNGDYSHWFVCCSEGEYFAFNADTAKPNVAVQQRLSFAENENNRYKLIDGEWVYEGSTFKNMIRSEFVYDSTGMYVPEAMVGFHLKPIEFDDYTDVYSKFTEQITVKNVVAVLFVGASAVAGIVFMWWGVRKLTRAVFSAFRKGKISV